MRTIKTDSLGLEILGEAFREEYKSEIKVLKELDKDSVSSEMIIFEIYEGEEVSSYFVMEEKTYTYLVNEYKIEGVEIK